jgi:hypothetical protein
MTNTTYQASRVKRTRATTAEMEVRAKFLIRYAQRHGPVTVRGLYYQAEVAALPGIDKTANGYTKIQSQVLNLRREGRLDYGTIADATRWMRKPDTNNSVEEALRATAQYYRKALWSDTEDYVEVWCEKDALAGVILPVTEMFDVPLMVARGFVSETFAYEAIDARGDDARPYYVYYLGDFDRSGMDAARSLEEKLTRFADEAGIPVVFETLAVTPDMVHDLRLPTRAPKRESKADKNWPHDFACELDAVPPDVMRELVQDAIERHLPKREFEILKVAETSERRIIERLVGKAVAS